MNITWISLAVAIIVGITKLLTYLLGGKRKLAELRKKRDELEEQLRIALSKNDTVRIAMLSLELERVRQKITDINGK